LYRCHNCSKTFAALTQDGCCDEIDCFGEPLLPDAQSSSQGGASPVISPAPGAMTTPPGSVEGLCVLVCDISGSMSTPAFPNHPAEKLKMVTGAVHKAIAELGTITKAENAYIALVAFGGRAAIVRDPQGQPFVKSVAQIVSQFGEGAAHLPTYLYDYFTNDHGGVDRGATDINAALKLAREIYDLTIAGDLSPIGVNATARLMDHSDIVTSAGQQISMPNIRVMIYSDGAHTGGALKNAFEGLFPSPLMTAFIGDDQAGPDARTGADQMKALANQCPEHGQKGYFLINAPERHAVLRNLFRMASGASGFCPQCLRRDFALLDVAR